MSTIAILLTAAIGAGAALAIYVGARARSARPNGRHATRPPGQKPLRNSGRASQFACVEIQLSADACPAARALADQIILASDAPALPLKGCDRHCRCAFIKDTDRRQESRRWSDEGISAALYSAAERRNVRDRRRR